MSTKSSTKTNHTHTNFSKFLITVIIFLSVVVLALFSILWEQVYENQDKSQNLEESEETSLVENLPAEPDLNQEISKVKSNTNFEEVYTQENIQALDHLDIISSNNPLSKVESDSQTKKRTYKISNNDDTAQIIVSSPINSEQLSTLDSWNAELLSETLDFANFNESKGILLGNQLIGLRETDQGERSEIIDYLNIDDKSIESYNSQDNIVKYPVSEVMKGDDEDFHYYFVPDFNASNIRTLEGQVIDYRINFDINSPYLIKRSINGESFSDYKINIPDYIKNNSFFIYQDRIYSDISCEETRVYNLVNQAIETIDRCNNYRLYRNRNISTNRTNNEEKIFEIIENGNILTSVDLQNQLTIYDIVDNGDHVFIFTGQDATSFASANNILYFNKQDPSNIEVILDTSNAQYSLTFVDFIQ